MSKSSLRMAKADKHLRLFELIRQGNMAEQTSTREVILSATVSDEVKAFRTQAAQSLAPHTGL